MIIIGRVRTKDIKNIVFEISEKYPDKVTADFESNKEFINELKLTDDKKIRNRIAGYAARVAKRKKK